MLSPVWLHYYRAKEKFKENKSNFEARCRYCVDAKVREIRTRELDEVVDNLRTEARTEVVLGTIKVICGKVETLWTHLAKHCLHVPLDIQQLARETKMERLRNKTEKENVHISAMLPTVSAPPTPARQMAPLTHARTMSLDSINTDLGSPTDPNEPPSKRLNSGSPVNPEAFYGETVPVARFAESKQAEFAADLCRLMVVSNIAWFQVEQPYWRAFFQKWLPQVLMPGRRELSGRILINTSDISALPKTAENLLEIVLSELKYCTEVLKLVVVAWCTDASGESAKMRRLLVRAQPFIVVLDCWCHQVNLIVGDIFKVKDLFVQWIDDALEVIKWFNSHTRALGMLKDVQRIKFGKALCLVLPVLTRWTSHYLAVQRLLELEIAFKQLLLDSTPDLLLCAGNKVDAKRKAGEIISILERYDFWANLQKIRTHLEPLAIAANATQSDSARLDVVLLTVANLHRIYSDTSLDDRVRMAVLKSLEKRWANADQPIFILAVILNPYLRTSPFSTDSSYRSFHQLWIIVKAAFKRMYGIEPDAEFRCAFGEYLRRVGEWSDDAMELEHRKELARRTKKPVNLIDVWREYDTIPESQDVLQGSLPKNGKVGLARLAMRVLSMVPNSASTERIFSQFGIVHTKLRNRLHPDKVRKQVLLKADTVARFGMPANRKRKFEHDDELQVESSSAIRNEPADPNEHTPVPANELTNTNERSPDSNTDMAEDCTHSHSFLSVARELMDDAIEADLDSSLFNPDVVTSVSASGSTSSVSDKDNLLLKTLFHYPSSSNTSLSASLSVLTEFWRASERGFETEVAFHDITQEARDIA